MGINAEVQTSPKLDLEKQIIDIKEYQRKWILGNTHLNQREEFWDGYYMYFISKGGGQLSCYEGAIQLHTKGGFCIQAKDRPITHRDFLLSIFNSNAYFKWNAASSRVFITNTSLIAEFFDGLSEYLEPDVYRHNIQVSSIRELAVVISSIYKKPYRKEVYDLITAWSLESQMAVM